MDLIIFAHPDSRNSHNAAILKHVKKRLAARRRPNMVVDLYAEKFDPVLKIVDDTASGSTFHDVKDYQELIRGADRLVFIYPILWYNMPAILKGFVERVFINRFAFEFRKLRNGNTKIVPLLKGKKAVVINTYGHGGALFRKYGTCSADVLDTTVLKFCGMKTKRVNWFSIRGSTAIPREIAKKIDAALG